MSEKAEKTRSVLIVDDEKLFLKSVAEGLRPYEKKKGFRTLTAFNGREALSMLRSQEIALLVTDLRMPEMDGISLISRVHNEFPSLPIIVMTAFGSPDIEKQVKEMGILHYLEKPIGFEDFRDHILNELKRKRRGHIEGVTLASFLQLLWMEKTTCTLVVKGKEGVGSMTILNGELQSAECDGETGEDSALRILSWPKVSIELEEQFTPSLDPLHLSIEELLLESFRLMDERNMEPLIEYEELAMHSELEAPNETPGMERPAPAGKRDRLKLNILSKKEERMDVSKLNKAIETLKESMGGALMATDIWGSADMQSIAGFNSQPIATALFGQIINSTNVALKEAGFPILGKYCVFDLVDGKMVVLIPMGDYAWGMLVDGKKAQLGLLLNVSLPKAIAAFEDAITS